MRKRRMGRYAAMALMLTGMAAWPAARAPSAPSVSGVSGALQIGAHLQITGGGFGTKAVAAPLKWDNFESGSVGSQIANGWTADGAANCGAPAHRPLYS